MPNVITFTPRPRPVVAEPALPAADAGLRAQLEEAAQTALDAADKIIAALDRIDDRAMIESKPAPVAIAAEPIQLPEPIEVQEPQPEITSTPISEPIILPEVIVLPEALPWYGAGNVVSFVGITILSLVAR